jgi:hypothetical protein
MDTFLKLLDIVALLIQFAGALLMYLNSPVNRITGNTHGGNFDHTIPNRKNKKLKFGFLLLSLGIILSLLSLLIKDFESSPTSPAKTAQLIIIQSIV